MKNLEKTFDTGIIIRAITSDQGSNNRCCYRLLGVTTSEPYFSYENKRIYALFDVPHLIKSIRNTLLKYDLLTPDGRVSWDILTQLYQWDSSQSVRICPKLTKSHLQPGTFDKMRVKFATQIFSKTVCAGIKTCISLNIFQNESLSIAKSTEKFISKINNTFDCLNSNNYFDKNIFKCALTENNSVLHWLEEIQPYVIKIKLLKDTNKNYCISGLQQSINAILQLQKDMFQYPDIKFLLTSRLNQDPIENLFAQIRAKNGNNRNPSVAIFNYSLAKIMSMKFITSKLIISNKNCEDDDDLHLDWNLTDSQEISTVNDDILPNEQSPANIFDSILENQEIELPVQNYLEKELKISQNAKRYFLGYAVFKIIITRLKCENCMSVMIKKIGCNYLMLPSEYFLNNKNYSSTLENFALQPPSDLLFDICKIHFIVFEKYFNEFLHIPSLKKKMLECCILATNDKYPEWYDPFNPCFEHHKMLTDFFLLVLIRKNCTWKIKDMLLNTSFNSKLTIIQQ